MSEMPSSTHGTYRRSVDAITEQLRTFIDATNADPSTWNPNVDKPPLRTPKLFPERIGASLSWMIVYERNHGLSSGMAALYAWERPRDADARARTRFASHRVERPLDLTRPVYETLTGDNPVVSNDPDEAVRDLITYLDDLCTNR